MFTDPEVEAEITHGDDPVSGEMHPVLAQLQQVMVEHMKGNPQLTLNGISKRISVSEPTLRRIFKGQVKTLINAKTLIEVLVYLSKESDISKIIQKYPGPIGDHLREHASFATENDPSQPYSEDLNRVLKSPIRYLVFKLASNSSGVAAAEIKELFGFHGLGALEELSTLGLVQENGGIYTSEFSIKGGMTLSHDIFVQNFKSVADFIKPDKLGQISNNNLFVNFSESVSLEAHREIVKIQREALKKCLKVLDSPKSKGSIPTFILAAVDTLSSQSAAEIDDQV